MPPRSPLNIFAATPISCANTKSSNVPLATAPSIRPWPMRSPSAGGCDVGETGSGRRPSAALWTAQALPSVIVLTEYAPNLADRRFRLPPLSVEAALAIDGGDRLMERHGAMLRMHLDAAGAEPPAALLPFDRLFEIRAAAAVRLWRGLTGRNPGPNPAALSPERRDRLILALRGLDGSLDGATHREIANSLFGANDIPARDWISHDLRDRTARLVRLGFAMMKGGYRRLLLHPYRGRP
jgi:hypothetical protein